MNALFKKDHYAPGFYEVVCEKLRNCPSCFLKKVKPDKDVVFKVGKKSTQPHQRWEFDHSHLPGLSFLLLSIGDHFAKKAWFRITKTETAEEVMQNIESIFQGGAVKPFEACFDNGPAFKSNLFQQYLNDREILVNAGVPYWPQGQGFVERLHKTFKTKLRLLKLPKTTTFEELSQHALNIENQYNNSPHETLNNRTPNAVYYNLPNSARELLYKNIGEIQKDVEQDAKVGHTKYLRTLIRKSQQLYQSGRTVQVGDRVIVLHGRAYKGRIQIIRTYLGAGTITRAAPDNSSLFYVKWLNDGKGSVKRDQESDQPFPNQYFSLAFSEVHF